MRLNGRARWISALAGSVVAGALLTGGIVHAISWFHEVQAHVSMAKPMMADYVDQKAETQRWRDQIERIIIWLVRIKCDEIIERRETPPPDCAGLPLPRLQDP